MSLEASEIAVAGTGHIWRAPVGTAFPSASGSVDETLWTELGYTSTGGVRFSFGKNVTEIMGWQSRDALRVIVKDTPRTVAADLLQTNQNVWNTAMGGGTWTEPTNGYYKWTPPAVDYSDEFALIVQAEDDDLWYRWCFRKVLNTTGVEFAANRENALMFPVTVKVLAADGGLEPFEFYTNDANLGEFADAGS